MSRSHIYKKDASHTVKRRTWFVGSRLGIIIAALLLGTTIIGELELQLIGPKAKQLPGWIIEGSQLQNLLGYAPSTLPATYFNTKNTVVLRNIAGSASLTPPGWHSQTGNHYTSYQSKNCGDGCSSLSQDLAAGNIRLQQKPVVMYDDEHWSRTPVSEQANPCASMSAFVRAAHEHGLTTIVAPDQNLAQPGVITTYKGGESENWQTYLRLGIGACAARSGSQWYHVMSQPFEAHWCGNFFDSCQSSESDFVNFVTQAALQAKAVNPNIKISDGLSTNPQYFSYFKGAAAFAQIMYRDYADVQRIISAVWLNVVGRNANTTALYFLSMLGRKNRTVRRSSVLFLQPDGSLRNSQPTGNQPDRLALASGARVTFVSRQTLSGGTSLPAGAGEFQFWTDGASGDSAEVEVTFGYCSGNGCPHRTAVDAMRFVVHGAANGAATPGGAFTTKKDAMLPHKGRYHLYVQVAAETDAPFDLLYGSHAAPTNLATPVLLPLQ